MSCWEKPLVRKPSLTWPPTHEVMTPIRAPPPPVVGGGTVVDVVDVVDEELVEVELVEEVEDVELVGLVLEVLELDEVAVEVTMKSAPTVWEVPLTHDTRVALAPMVVDGRGADVAAKVPALPVELNRVELSAVPVASGPEKTSNTPSLAPDPSGQPVPAKPMAVPTGPLSGLRTYVNGTVWADAGMTVSAIRPKVTHGHSLDARFVIDLMGSPPFEGRHR